MYKKTISLLLCIFMLANAAAITASAASLPITETLETPLVAAWCDEALNVDASSRVEQTPEEYLFSLADDADTKEYILLKSVNANAGDGFFVMTNGYTEGGAAYDTNSYGATNSDHKGTKTEQSLVYDPERDGSVAQRLNADSYIEEHFPLMKDYINTHTWYTEEGYGLDSYKTDCKISLLSTTEYTVNAGRIGYKPNGEAKQWWLRSPHKTAKYYAMWEFLPGGTINCAWDVESTYINRVIRPCFYLNEDFFKNVKLDTSKMGDEVKRAMRESISYSDAQSLYSNLELISIGYELDETLETPLVAAWCDDALNVDASARVAETPDEYLFSTADDADTKEYILLNSVNANAGDGFFIMTNGYTEAGVAYDSTPYGTTSSDHKGTKTAQSLIYDVDRNGSIAQRLNADSYIEEHFPLMKDYINTHTWYTEQGYGLVSYKTDCKISLLSTTEYKMNAGRIGYKPNGEEMQWWLRSPHKTVKDYAMWEFLPRGTINCTWDMGSTYSNRVVRPCFYLNEDFFKNVKLDTSKMGDEVKRAIRENVSFSEAQNLYSTVELISIGYGTDENLETPLIAGWSDDALNIDVSARKAQTPEEYLFSAADDTDTKEYILLKNVNAKENDGFFVMTNGYTENGIPYDTNSYGTTSSDHKGTKTAQSVVYAPDRAGSIAQMLNSEEYISEHFPLMKDYINTHTWYTEQGYELASYKTNCKISLLSLTEYKVNYDRIGYKPNGEEKQWWLRSPHTTVKDYAIWEFLPKGTINCTWDMGSTYSNRVVRPCFYLNEDFFKNVKLNTAAMGSEVKKAIRETMTVEEARNLYSNVEVADLGYDIHAVGFDNARLSKNGNILRFDAFVSNNRRDMQSFVLVAAIYKNGELAKVQREYELLPCENRRVAGIEVDMSEFASLANIKIKVFALSAADMITPVSSVIMEGDINTLLNTAPEGYEKTEIIIPEAYKNIYNRDNSYFDVSIIYAGNGSKTYTVSYSFDNWKTQTDEKITASYITNLKKRIKITAPPLGESNLKIKVSAEDGVKADKECTVSVIRFYEEKPLDKYYNVATGQPFDWYTYPKEHVALLKKLGFTSLRSTPSWNVVEREKGTLAIADGSNTANNIETYAENGVNISTLTVGYGNKYYTDNTITSRLDMQPPTEKNQIDAFVNYASNVPSLLKTKDGKALSFKRYEIWNEPNLYTYWGYEEGSVPDPIQYIYLFNHTSARIKQSNPDTAVSAGAFARGADGTYNFNQNYLDKMYDLGLLKYADEYSFHPYLYPKNPDTGFRSDGMYASYVKTYVENVSESYLASRKKHGGWIEAGISEVGWTTFIDANNANKNGYGEYGRYGTSEDDQAIYTVKALVYNNYLGISHTDIFTAYDRGSDKNDSEHNFGFIRNDYSLKPAVYALSQYNNTCSSAQYLGRVELAEDVYGYVYQSLTKPFMIVWKKMMNVNTGTPYQYTLPSGARAEDMFGNAIDGTVINIGTEPVYIYDIPLTLVKDAFDDLSVDAFKNFSAYSTYKAKLDSYIALNTMPTAEKQLEMLNDLYVFGRAVIAEKKSNPSIMDNNDFMYALFEVYEASKRMASAYAMYDAEYPTSDADVSSANSAILAKKDNQAETSLLFTDAIMRYAKRHSKTANEVRQLESFTGKTGFTAMNDYLAKNLCSWAMDIMATETVDISRALLPYAKSKIETNANESYTLNFTLDSMLTIPFESLAYIADGNGVARSAKTALNVDANSSASVDLTGNSVSTAGEYTYYIAVENNGKVTIKQPFTLTVK